MGESVTLGLIGGVIGVGLGFAGAELVTKLSKPLTRLAGADHGLGHARRRQAVRLRRRRRRRRRAAAAGGGGGSFAASRAATNAANHTVTVHLLASVTGEIIVLAVVLAVAGGIIAGMFGGWRAARLRPAAALSKVG